MLKRADILSGRTAGWFLAGLLILTMPVARAAVLTHRYPFDSDANDVIGTAHGVMQGAAVLADGAVVLNGTNSAVQLPDDLFTNYSSLSFEAWFVDEGATNANAMLYQFSGVTNRMNYVVDGVGTWSSNAVAQRVYIPMPVPGLTNHLVWAQDSVSKTASVFINGVLAARNTNFTLTPIVLGSTTNNWIGASRAGSAVFKGRILEFRTYQGALTNLEVAQLCAAGPDQPNPVPGALQSIRLEVPLPAGPGALLSPAVYGNYANLTNVNLMGQPGLTLVSDATNVIFVTNMSNVVFPIQTSAPFDSLSIYTNVPLRASTWKLRTRAVGTANVKAIFQGFSNTVPVTVVTQQITALIHRYSFNEPRGTYVAHDSIGAAHGRVMGAPQFNTFNNNGELALGYGQPGYLKFPPGLISGLSEVTVEAWLVYDGVILAGNWVAWSRIFEFGDQNAGTGKTYLFMTPRNDANHSRAVASSNGIPAELTILESPGPFPVATASHVAMTYSPSRALARYYINGQKVDERAARIPLVAINDINNWIGRSLFVEDPYIQAKFNEFRIYRGFLQDAEIAAEYAVGPNVVSADVILQTAIAGTNLTISWGPTAASWSLKSSPALGPGAVWTDTAPPTPLPNGRFGVVVSVTEADEKFFRLQSP